ncbi:MAG TPA: 6-phosphogluconolactonase [Alphaproteobacteria bacterium]|nr:6-phosphogluconolactonase [Alphaproteobacteria bacterium]
MAETPTTEPLVEVLENPDAVSRRVADWLASEAAQTEGRFAIALSGGSTPKHMYEMLGRPPQRDMMPWERVQMFWGDERFVPPDHPDSNYRMVREALLEHVPIPSENIHPIVPEGTPDEAAAAYEATLNAFYGSNILDAGRPLFDIVLLGVGQDGHTASLFPGSPILDEKKAWARATEGPGRTPRITLTYPALASSRNLAFMVTGKEKSSIVSRVLKGDRDLPAARVKTIGRSRWFMDRAAAGETE